MVGRRFPAGRLSWSGLTGLTLLSLGLLMAGPACADSPKVIPGGFKERVEEALKALATDPRLKDVPREKLQANAEFVTGNVLYAALHEMGHALIDDMYLYVLSREEDAADAFATVYMLKIVVHSLSTCLSMPPRAGSMRMRPIGPRALR
jgi:hypothetical protein